MVLSRERVACFFVFLACLVATTAFLKAARTVLKVGCQTIRKGRRACSVSAARKLIGLPASCVVHVMLASTESAAKNVPQVSSGRLTIQIHTHAPSVRLATQQILQRKSRAQSVSADSINRIKGKRSAKNVQVDGCRRRRQKRNVKRPRLVRLCLVVVQPPCKSPTDRTSASVMVAARAAPTLKRVPLVGLDPNLQTLLAQAVSPARLALLVH